MLGFLFGFNARLGRLHFFLATIAVAVLMTAICFAIAGHAFQNASKGMIPSLSSWQAIAAAILFIWLSFTLQSMRIRDIGWDPVCVIPGWIAVTIIDGLLAGKIPAISLGAGQHGTIVGALVNLALFLALLFWPSSGQDNSAPTSGDPFRMPDLPSRSPAATASRVARVANGEFGRRAV
ncbi:DUF805 domain-containing protein [Bradyrhizobium sp. 170]|jgi:uncharacterized membrane protein YhaH (DUF805 family)|uniref:DUF805 domain-containing protein n=1 Tax=Bradyrhizobium sp. 170 TaxID=2782641 RepID=UPI001FFF1A81|nr:DUF805 domain-containing protein [Bradyrhizobium sp. 170]UPK04647.1 DUF805 domain-containing protein [Bradyrhizobium sp. 170]